MKKVILLISIIASVKYIVADDSKVYQVALEVHNLSEQCPHIELKKIDSIIEEMAMQISDFTQKEMYEILSSSKSNNLMPYQKSESLAFIHESASCEYLAKQLEWMLLLSRAFKDLGKEDLLVRNVTAEDISLATNFLRKLQKEEK